MPTRVSLTATHARIGGAAARNRPRRIEDRPSASGTPAVACRRQKAALTQYNVLTAAVFHTPMFALNADADSNACEPSRTVHTNGKGAYVDAHATECLHVGTHASALVASHRRASHGRRIEDRPSASAAVRAAGRKRRIPRPSR